jgi:hypothetical protein
MAGHDPGGGIQPGDQLADLTEIPFDVADTTQLEKGIRAGQKVIPRFQYPARETRPAGRPRNGPAAE